MQLKAGFAQRDITPTCNMDMGGFLLRRQPSLGTHDPLFVKALVLDDGRQRVAIVSCDLLGFANADDDRLRTAIVKATDIPAANIFIACTHTHSGPAAQFLKNCGSVDRRWLRRLRPQVAQTVALATARLESVNVRRGRGRARLNYNRRHSPAIDPTVTLLQFRPVANILHYACHPVVLAERNLHFSADYCGVASRFITARTGAPTLFLNGACGDVDPRVPRRDNSFRFLTTFGQRLGKAALGRCRQVRATRIEAAFRRVKVGSLALSLQRIQIGSQPLIGIGGEVFVSTGRKIQRLLGRNALVVGYANGNIGYLPPPEEFPRGGYEVNEARKFYGLPPVLPQTEAIILRSLSL